MVLVPSFIPSRFQAGGSYGPRLGVGSYPQAPAAQPEAAMPMPPAQQPTAPAAPAPQPGVMMGARDPERFSAEGGPGPGSAADGNFGVDAGRDLGMSFGQFATNTLNGMGIVGPMGLATLGGALLASEITGNPTSFGLFSAATGSSLADMFGNPAAAGANMTGMPGNVVSVDPYSDPLNAFDPGIAGEGYGGLSAAEAAAQAQADRGGMTEATMTDIFGSEGGGTSDGPSSEAGQEGSF